MKYKGSIPLFGLLLHLFGSVEGIAQIHSKTNSQDTANSSASIEKRNRKTQFDFSLQLKSISDGNVNFKQFQNRNLLLFYFSTKCAHCQTAFPHIQEMAEKLRGLGFSTLVIAVRNNTEADIRNFIREFQCKLPVLHDENRNFAISYGTGSVPLVMLVTRFGNYIRYEDFDEEKTPLIISKQAHELSQVESDSQSSGSQILQLQK